MANRYALERVNVKLDLIYELAGDVQTHAELARTYGVTRSSVHEFAQRHAERITEVRRAFDSHLAGIEFAEKRARIEALSKVAGDNLRILDDSTQAARIGANGRAELGRTVIAALRGIADERGDIPQRIQVAMEAPLNVTINGVDLESLR